MDGATTLLSAGGLIGLSVAAPIGPMGVLCIKRTLTQGLFAGVSTGFGATTAQVCICALLLFGMDQLAPITASHRQALSVVSAGVMLFFAWRVGRRHQPVPSARRAAARSVLFAYVTALGFNLTNPMSAVLLLAAMAAILGPTLPSGVDGAWLLAGLFLGSATWWIGLSSVTTMLSRRLNAPALARVNRATAAILAGLALLTLARAVL